MCGSICWPCPWPWLHCSTAAHLAPALQGSVKQSRKLIWQITGVYQLYGGVCVARTWSHSSVMTSGKSSCPQASQRASSCQGWLPELDWKDWEKTFWGSKPVSILLCNEAEDVWRAQGLVCLLPAVIVVGPLKQRCECRVPKEGARWFFCSPAAEMLRTWGKKEALVALWKWWGKLMVLLDREFSLTESSHRKLWLPKPREDLGQINHFLGEFTAYWLPRVTHSDV